MGKKYLYLDGNPSDEFYNSFRNSHNGVTATSIFSNSSKISKIIRRMLLKLGLPFHKNVFGSWKEDINKFDVIIIAANMYSQVLNRFIRNYSDVKIIHWYWNPLDKSISPEKLKNWNSEIWSFDLEDCKKSSLCYSPTYYFDHIEIPKREIINDVFFIGAEKGRLTELLNVKNTLIAQGLDVNFHITPSSKSPKGKYNYQKRISYEKSLELISESRAILDIVQKNQNGLTQRPMEALFFKKKLISNDKTLIDYDFYNKNNIFILGVDNIGDINSFILSPYEEIESSILKKYTFQQWLKRLTNGEGMSINYD